MTSVRAFPDFCLLSEKVPYQPVHITHEADRRPKAADDADFWRSISIKHCLAKRNADDAFDDADFRNDVGPIGSNVVRIEDLRLSSADGDCPVFGDSRRRDLNVFVHIPSPPSEYIDLTPRAAAESIFLRADRAFQPPAQAGAA